MTTLIRSHWLYCLLLALVCLIVSVQALRKPIYNMDMVPYVVLAKTYRGESFADAHQHTYTELREKFGELGTEKFFRPPHDQLIRDLDTFEHKILPLYAIRPLYIASIAAVGSITGNDIDASWWVSVISMALAVAVFGLLCLLACQGGAMAWLFLPMPFALGAVGVASISTPDALACAVIAALAARLHSRGWQLEAGAAAMLALLICARSDYLIFALGLTIWLWWHGVAPGRHQKAAAITLILLGINHAIQKLSGNFGFLPVYNLTLIDGYADLRKIPNHHFDLMLHLRLLLSAANKILETAEFSVYLLLMMATGLLSRIHQRANPWAWLAWLGCGYAAIHILLFPKVWNRFFIASYLLAAIAFVVSLHLLSQPRTTPADQE